MNFAEIFERYKKGIATEEEIKEIEEEIQKSELLAEYFEEKMQLEFGNLTDIEAEKDMKDIQKKINRNVWKKVVLAFAILCSLLIVGYYLVERICTEKFYNPLKFSNKTTEIVGDAEELQQAELMNIPLYLNVDTFLSIHCPDQVCGSMEFKAPYLAEGSNKGFGSYGIKVKVSQDFGETNVFSTTITRGKTESSERFFEIKTRDLFYEAGPQFHTNANGKVFLNNQNSNDRKEMREEMQELPESVLIASYISFEEDMTLEELFTLFSTVENEYSLEWAAVRTTNEQQYEVMGIDLSGIMRSIYAKPDLTDEFNKEFPYFYISDADDFSKNYSANEYELHFKSMLKYMTYQDEFLKTFCGMRAETYQDALSYVEENGVNVFGVYVIGSPNAMLEIESMSGVESFEISDVVFSKYDR